MNPQSPHQNVTVNFWDLASPGLVIRDILDVQNETKMCPSGHLSLRVLYLHVQYPIRVNLRSHSLYSNLVHPLLPATHSKLLKQAGILGEVPVGVPSLIKL